MIFGSVPKATWMVPAVASGTCPNVQRAVVRSSVSWMASPMWRDWAWQWSSVAESLWQPGRHVPIMYYRSWSKCLVSWSEWIFFGRIYGQGIGKVDSSHEWNKRFWEGRGVPFFLFSFSLRVWQLMVCIEVDWDMKIFRSTICFQGQSTKNHDSMPWEASKVVICWDVSS